MQVDDKSSAVAEAFSIISTINKQHRFHKSLLLILISKYMYN